MIPAPVARLFNRPVALLPAHVQTIEQLLQVNAASALFETSEYGQRKPYQVIGGVAEIVVDGLLLDGDDWCGWGVTSYSAIRQAFNAALADAVVQAIALTINSPGGVVNGCFDLADEIAAARDIKPVWAILNENAFSAAYAIASSASRIIIPRTGGAGSIGVVWMHTDVTAMLAQAGIKITTLQFGATKTDSYPTTTLTDAARGRMQADVDAMGELFVDTVARNRGLAASAVRDTEAATYLGAAAVTAGLADAVQSPDQAFRALLTTLA